MGAQQQTPCSAVALATGTARRPTANHHSNRGSQPRIKAPQHDALGCVHRPCSVKQSVGALTPDGCPGRTVVGRASQADTAAKAQATHSQWHHHARGFIKHKATPASFYS